MSATVLEILEKTKPHPFVTAQPDNFAVRAGAQTDSHILLEHPHISLYCLDDSNQQAWFVETPPEVDLSQAPFYYNAQYEHALRLYTVPYPEFHQLAETLPAAQVIYVHSIGRCGSTLISKALNAVDGVLSLSEPDIYTQLYFLRYLDGSRDAEYTRLLRSCTRFYGKNTPVLALKFRAMCIQMGDLLHNAVPSATHLFLYRHMQTWMRSIGLEYRPPAERRAPVQEFPVHRRGMAPLSVPFAAEHGREANFIELAALSWLSMMEQYVALCEQGIPFLALRYEDIQAHPQAVLARVLEYCGLAANVEGLDAVLAADSQEGTALSRSTRQQREVFPLDAEEYAQIEAVFASRPHIRSLGFVAPHTARFT